MGTSARRCTLRAPFHLLYPHETFQVPKVSWWLSSQKDLYLEGLERLRHCLGAGQWLEPAIGQVIEGKHWTGLSLLADCFYCYSPSSQRAVLRRISRR